MDEFVIKKSRFIGYSKPVEDEQSAQDFIAKIIKDHYNATHNCSAYIIGEGMEVQRYSDDGEPSGTAGIPILEVLKRNQVCNACIVVTRYYGGIMLGAAGLLRAYTQGASIAIDNASLIEKIPHLRISFELDYSLHGRFMNDLSNNGYMLANSIFEDKVRIELLLRGEQKTGFERYLADLTSGNGNVKDLDWEYVSVGIKNRGGLE